MKIESGESFSKLVLQHFRSNESYVLHESNNDAYHLFTRRTEMKNFLKIISVVFVATFLGTFANFSSADPSSGWQGGHGPGMMGGYGYGYGMGPGMMGGDGSGSGSGYGYGYGMGPGMMGGYGMGPGMMGPGMMGQGMLGWGNFRALNLNADQKSKIAHLRREMRTKQWAVMGEMMDAREKLQDLWEADKQDSAAINKQYKVIEDLRRQMVENAVETHNKINSILTKEQREKLHEEQENGYGYGRMMRGR